MGTEQGLSGNRLHNFAQRPAEGTRGGILMLWDDNLVYVSNITTTNYWLYVMVRIRESKENFKLTSVYGPTRPRSQRCILWRAG